MQRSADWMDQAQGDLEHARSSLELGHHDWAALAAQQASEKAVKAVFQLLGAEARGHSVMELLQALESSGTALPPGLLGVAGELDSVYLPSRYPDALPSSSPRRVYSLELAQRLIEHADRIVRFCQDLLARP